MLNQICSALQENDIRALVVGDEIWIDFIPTENGPERLIGLTRIVECDWRGNVTLTSYNDSNRTIGAVSDGVEKLSDRIVNIVLDELSL